MWRLPQGRRIRFLTPRARRVCSDFIRADTPFFMISILRSAGSYSEAMARARIPIALAVDIVPLCEDDIRPYRTGYGLASHDERPSLLFLLEL